jgi:hypothetical protein
MVMVVYSQSKNVEKRKSIRYRINGAVNESRMQEGPRFDVTRKGNRVPTYELLYEQYGTR